MYYSIRILIQSNSNNQFKTSLLWAVFLLVCTGAFLLFTGKKESFIIINSHYSFIADYFFKYYTNAGDAWGWSLLLLYSIFFKKKYIVAVIAGIIISTFLAQFLKRMIFPDDLRPITYLAENFPVHLVDGARANRVYSFPSGHTAAAFTIALIMSHMINKKIWSFILPVLALLVGYSRVYLAQHFLTDVFAGMLIGIVSAIFSLMIYRAFIRYLNKKTASKSETA